ncbi:hypothetical protein KPSA1_03572 [Pseudomonas syringae pv. actinidiae]|uniref:Uncharacterized protein n=1 Tax=Pseudomonas syringae pv. actinidiae TaxID=103796 RepID=A0A2V0QNI6_PSESF|nr:hypothetical protein KPSA1_03572 [Pseudomonas syringae pv. actinidiae]
MHCIASNSSNNLGWRLSATTQYTCTGCYQTRNHQGDQQNPRTLRNTLGSDFSRFTCFLFSLSFQFLILGISLTIAGLSLINDLIGFSVGLVATCLDQVNQRLTVSSVPSLVAFGFDAIHQAAQLLVGLLRVLCALFSRVLCVLLGSLGFLLDVVRVQLGFAGLTHGGFDFTLNIVQVEVDALRTQLVLNLAAHCRSNLSDTAAQRRHAAACQIKTAAHDTGDCAGDQVHSDERYSCPDQQAMKSTFALSQTTCGPTADEQRNDRADNHPDACACTNTGQRIGFLHRINAGAANGSA